MTAHQFWLSIIMPARNAERFIAEAITSIQNQAFADWELVIVNDHSNDGTATVAAACADADQRIRLVSAQAHGVSAARNQGLDEARGQLIGFLDADDFMLPGGLDLRVSPFQDEGVQATYCPCELVDEKGKALGVTIDGETRVSFEHMAQGNLHLNSIIVRRQALTGIRFDEAMSNGEDWLFNQRLLRTGLVMQRIPQARVAYRQHPEGCVASDYGKHVEAMRRISEILYSPDRLCPAPDHKYVNGLRSGTKEDLDRSRDFTLVLALLMEGRITEAVGVYRSHSEPEWRRINFSQAARLLTLTACRQFRRPLAQVSADLATCSKSFSEFATANDIAAWRSGIGLALAHPALVHRCWHLREATRRWVRH